MDPRLIIVAAVAENNVIGRSGALPWRLPADMERFKTLTLGQTVLMGRTTWESLPTKFRPLPGRLNIVLSRQQDYSAPGAYTFRSLDEALNVNLGPMICVIGGQHLYAEALRLADELHLTLVHAKPEGDALFPHLAGRFTQTEVMRFAKDKMNEYDYSFTVFCRHAPPRSMVHLGNARRPQQWATMERIQLDGVCPFCPSYIARYHNEPIINENADWLLTKNQWPYENTEHHFLVIARRHAERLNQLSPTAWPALGELVAFAEKEFGIVSGSLRLRFGDPRQNGGTVRHLHAQLLSR